MTEVAQLLKVQDLSAERKNLLSKLNHLPITKEYQTNKQLYETMLQAQKDLIEKLQQNPDDSAVRERLDDVKNRLAKQREQVLLLQTEGQSQYQALKDEIEGIPRRIEEIKGKIRPDLWQQFVQLSERYPGRAVAQVRRSHCLGCGLGVSQSTLSRLRAGSTSVVHCEHCDRLLMWE